jgi:hypothetical protein
MAKKTSVAADGSPPVEPKSRKSPVLSRTPLRASSLLDTRVIYCGDNLEQLAKIIIPPTIHEILDEEILGKLA